MPERTVTVIVVGVETAPGGKVTDASPAVTTPPEGPMTFEVDPLHMQGPKLEPSDAQTWPPAHPPTPVHERERPGVHRGWVPGVEDELHATAMTPAATATRRARSADQVGAPTFVFR